MKPLDVLAIVAHPDDAELGCGGTLLLHAHAGQRTGIIDLSQGETGTRGNAAIRCEEAKQAAKILGLSVRRHLTLPDGFINDTKEERLLLIGLIRHYRPRIILTNPPKDRHPDHETTARLVKNAAFLAGLPKIVTENEGKLQEAHRPKQLYYFATLKNRMKTSFIIDISSVFRRKMEALAAYRSQFHQSEPSTFSNEPQTYISTPAFQQALHSQHTLAGFGIGAAYGEAFSSLSPVGIASLDALL